jgi:hypothetical protein
MSDHYRAILVFGVLTTVAFVLVLIAAAIGSASP